MRNLNEWEICMNEKFEWMRNLNEWEIWMNEKLIGDKLNFLRFNLR